MTQNYRFDRFEYRSIERQLHVDGRPVAIGPRTLEVLAVLLERRESLVTTRELLDLVWADSDVEESNVQVQISLLRKVLGHDAVVTVPGRGYRIALPVADFGHCGIAGAPPASNDGRIDSGQVDPGEVDSGHAFDSEQLDRMLAGQLYDASAPELVAARRRAERILADIDACPVDAGETRRALLNELLGSLGAGTEIMSGLRCDYGFNISIGDRSFVNYGCVLLDCNRITIGSEVLIAPGVHLCTASHPLDARQRRTGLELALPVSIGDGAWIGEGAIVCPGVTIGENTVIGAGSVVTRDVPPNVLAVGNPCRPVRSLEQT